MTSVASSSSARPYKLQLTRPRYAQLRFGSILAVLCFFSQLSISLAQEAPEKAPVPRLVIEEKIFDFKEVEEGNVLEHAFKVLNKGDAPLEIKKVQPG